MRQPVLGLVVIDSFLDTVKSQPSLLIEASWQRQEEEESTRPTQAFGKRSSVSGDEWVRAQMNAGEARCGLSTRMRDERDLVNATTRRSHQLGLDLLLHRTEERWRGAAGS